MYELSGVAKSYDGHDALRPTDLSVEANRTTVLIGPSGSGKSTLLRIMLGLIRPDAGTVRFGNAAMTAESVLQLRRRMGYVIQHGGLFPHLTAFENISVMAGFLGWGRRRMEERIAELAGLTRFSLERLQKYPGQLSGGQRQRVSLMRALMLEPDVLLLDEPLGALDPMIRSELQIDLRQIFVQLEKTVVLVTHDLAEAAFFGDVIVLLRDGAIIQRGAITELMNRPANEFVTRFVTAQRSLHTGLEG